MINNNKKPVCNVSPENNLFNKYFLGDISKKDLDDGLILLKKNKEKVKQIIN